MAAPPAIDPTAWHWDSVKSRARTASASRQRHKGIGPAIWRGRSSPPPDPGRGEGGTEDLSISSEAITAGAAQTEATLELASNLVVNPNDTFAVYFGPTEPSGAVNYIDDTDAATDGDASLLIRDMLGNWAEGTGNVSIHCVSDCPAFFFIPSSGIFPSADSSTAAIDSLTGGSSTSGDSIDSLLNTLFNAFAAITPTFNQESMTTGEAAGIELPTNTMSPLAPETSPPDDAAADASQTESVSTVGS